MTPPLVDARAAVRATLRELELLARRAGAPVRYERVRVARDPSGEVGRGGLVRLRDATFIVCDAALPAIDRVFVVASALRALEIEVLHLPPLVRALVRRRTPISRSGSGSGGGGR